MSNKLLYLESIRGIAALIVVIWHFLLLFVYSDDVKKLIWKNVFEYSLDNQLWLLFMHSPLSLLINGQASVRLFFVLSGFVLTYKFFKTRDYEYLSAGAIKRYFRLVGIVVFSLLITYIFINIGIIHGEFINNNFTFIDFIKESFLLVFIASEYSIHNPPLWTMSYEFYGSMFVFFVASFFAKYDKRYIIYGILIVLFHKTLYLGFILGMILSDYHNTALFKKVENKINNKILYFLLFTALLLYTISGVRQQIWGAGIFLFVLLHNKLLQKYLEHKLLVFFGKISFSIYAIHSVILCSLTFFLKDYIFKFLFQPISLVLSFIVSLVVILCIGYFVERYIDANSIKLSKKIYSFIKADNKS